MADEDLDLDTGEEPKSSKKMLIIIIVGVVLLLGLGIVGGMFMGGMFDDETTEQTENGESGEESDDGDEEEGDDGDEGNIVGNVSYWPLDPPFVLNFEGKSKARYMQIGIEVMATNEKAIEAVKLHMPVIRSEIVLLLSGQKYEEIVTPEGKEQLRLELLETIQNILRRHKIKRGIERIYFTSFVMQ